jgi:hypothetical protein
MPIALLPLRRRRSVRGPAGPVCAALAAVAVLAPSAQARTPDRTPPAFAGLTSATTCIPGPIGPGISSSYHLGWEAASDNRTKPKGIVYAVYQATRAGGEDFSRPTYVSKRGATSFETPKLPSSQSWFFVVRARDRAGNEDANTVEREGVNLCE